MILFTINSTSMESMDAIQHYDIMLLLYLLLYDLT